MISLATFARQKGLSRPAVSKASKPGGWLHPAVIQENNKTGLDPRKATACYEENRDLRKQRTRTKTGPKPDTFADHQAIKMKYDALRAKVNYEKEAGNLCEREKVLAAGFNAGLVIKKALEEFPERCAPLLVGKSQNEIADLLRKETQHTLVAAQHELNAMTDSSPQNQA